MRKNTKSPSSTESNDSFPSIPKSIKPIETLRQNMTGHILNDDMFEEIIWTAVAHNEEFERVMATWLLE